MIYSRPAILDDIRYLAENLRPADLREIAAASGKTPYEALVHGWIKSGLCDVICVDHQPIAIYGIATDPKDYQVGWVWMLATPEMEKNSRAFLRRCRSGINDFCTSLGFTMYTNWVDARNEVHIRWLRWLGFTFIRKAPYGVSGLPFYEFVKIV